MIKKDFKVIQCVSFTLLIYYLIFSNIYTVTAQNISEDRGKYLKYNYLEKHIEETILTKPLIDEGCWNCHQDMYPDLAPNPDSPGQSDSFCFKNLKDQPYPLYYSTLGFEPNEKFLSFNPSTNFTNGSIYRQRKKGHLSHLIYQPFGMGRWCLDCHDSARYSQADQDTPHPSDKNVYFKDGKKLNQTTICKDCHGGFYPEGSIVPTGSPNISDYDSIRVLQWGNPGSVTCLQCHDDTYENGGKYASYISRYSSDDPASYIDGTILFDPNRGYFYHNWEYNDINGYLITAPDPDTVPGQNYWSKNGHGITAEKSFDGATLDTGYPDPTRPNRTSPNKGAMNSENIPSGKHSNIHDLNLDPNDGRKNFCWECHWSNEITKKTICVAKSESTPKGMSIGKYNGHLDTDAYRDERWGDINDVSGPPHHQWKECRECHTTKYSHFVFKAPKIRLVAGGFEDPPRKSHCVSCHNPHGSGDKQGKANVFMIKTGIYKYSDNSCNNCHWSQFQISPYYLDPGHFPSPGQTGSPYPDPNKDLWVVNFLDPLKQDIRESNSSENSIEIPASTSDICEVCHYMKDVSQWPKPGGLNGYQHRNGSRHYFNPNNDPCPNPDTCVIDYRGTDCTGCHIHDPGPVPDSQDEIEDTLSSFNSKAFAPTCRCHGIGRIDIATLSYETYWGKGNPPDISGKGHGLPPPPFPDGDQNQDPHAAHARYNFPCLRCHIDPGGSPYNDPKIEYIFDLNNHTPVGFDKFLNPKGKYTESTNTCSNLYCHSNGKGTYTNPIAWSEAEKFCRDTLTCIDTDGHFKYCDNCHKTPPDQTGTNHFGCSTNCDECHPHNGIYEGNSEFYKHVNGQLDIAEIINTFNKDIPGGCGCCHDDPDIPEWGKLHKTIEEDKISCAECHGDDHEVASLHQHLDESDKCGYCHGDPPPIKVLVNGIVIDGAHPTEASDCQTCHPGVNSSVRKHYSNPGEVNIIQSWDGANSCGVCHTDVPVIPCGGGPLSIHATLGPSSNCADCHGNHADMIYGDTPAKCIACHSPNPSICDICGPGSIATHYAFDAMGINQAAIQDCLSCHVEPLGGGEANPLEHIDNPKTFVKEGACLGCHSLARIRHGATDSLGCYACHPTHCVTEYARNDACIWCHTTNPPIVDICKMGIGITSHMAFDSSVFNQIQVTNCIGCHVEPITGGEANPINHIDNPMTYVNPLTCIGCHSVVVPHGGSGLPWAGGVWPAVNCYSCHPTHCLTTYCDIQACVWCHTDAPPLLNVCGRPGIVPHTGDCINCHAAGVPTGGECNPIDHMNGITYVRDGTCIGCHANVTTTHGPGTEACILCHPAHCAFTYCSEPQCKLCHNQPAFEIVSDYGCGIGLHDPPAYKECNRCHPGECNPQNHTLGPMNFGLPTDLSGMQLNWMDCGLCHSEAQMYHAPCNAPCTLCHSGASIHACVDLDYCAENKCKCCHASPTFPINSDYGCGVGVHAPEAYINCSLCHVNECNALNHMDTMTDVSNMALDWPTCGLCHKDAQASHIKCNQPCTACHSGNGNHACLDLNYCTEPQCKCCHADPVFTINSDYGCGTGPHSAQAYVDCTMCHIEECNVIKHIDGLTDVSNMPLNWTACGLCHVGAQASHVNCPEPCTLCHSGTGNHSCLELDYCTETECKCCHIEDIFTINSDYGCGTGTHPLAAYVDCTMCHIGECISTNHIDTMTDVSNMPLNWTACGLCHVDAQTIHVNCPEPCTVCHTGTSNHSCLELDYCTETKCKCCHIQNTFTINSDYGCGTGTHAAAAYVDCTMCHIGECTPGNHLDTTTDISNMPLTWTACGLCHVDAQASHANCPETCTLCHSGISTHACTELNYCTDQKCRCCHINVPLHFNTQCDCSTCHSAECDPLEHDITGVSANHPMDPLYYNYTGTSNDVGCTCCHGYPPQCVCIGISDTQDHCLDLANGCSPQIFDCMPCHTLFNGQPNHIYTTYGTPAVIASCACHGDTLGTTGAHSKHLTTPVMLPVYGTGNVIDCQACHSATTNLADHVVCVPGPGVTAPVQFDAALPMIGQIDSYTPGATPGTGSCNLYCHSDGTEDPLDVPGTYTYLLGTPPFWNQTTGIVSCGNAVLGTTAVPIYQCHGYPPPTHPGGAGGGGGGGILNCLMCHPTPLLGTAPDITVHINGAVDVTGGGFGAGGPGGGGGGVGGGIPVI